MKQYFFQQRLSGKNGGGKEEKKFSKDPVVHDGTSYLYLCFHFWNQDGFKRITSSASIEVIWKMSLIFNGEHWSFHLETGYDLHTFFQNLRNNEKKRKAQIVSGSKRKIPRVLKHSNRKVSCLITLVGAPDNRITVLYEQVLTPRGNDHSRYLNSI